MKGKTQSVLILIILVSNVLMGCGSISDSLTSGEQGETTIDLAYTTEPILTPTPDNPTPTPISEPLYYQYKGTSAFPEITDYGEYYEYFNSYEKWLLTDAGIEFRIEECMNYFDITETEATRLLIACYMQMLTGFNPVDYASNGEIETIDGCVQSEKLCYDIGSNIIGIYSIIVSCFENDTPRTYYNVDPFYYMFETYQLNLECYGDIHEHILEDMYYDDLEDYYDYMDSVYGIEKDDYAAYSSDEEYYAFETTAGLPMSGNGYELKFGDKVEKDGGLHYYGGTAYEVDGERVMVRWETKRDVFGFNSWSYLSQSEKSNPLSGPFGMPYDDKYYNASELKKIDFLSW